MNSLAIFLCLLSTTQVAAHGFLSEPKSRNYLARERGDDYCPHCKNGGTVGTVQANSIEGKWPYPETVATSVRHGLCGDAAGAEQSLMRDGSLTTGEITGTYAAGSVMEAKITVTTHHRGHVEFSLCDRSSLADSSGPITQGCLNSNKLKVVQDPEGLSFVDPAHPTRFYLPPKCAGSLDTDPLYPEAFVYKVLLQLPSTPCPSCVLQWYYVTGNTCNAPGYRDAPWPSRFTDCSGDGPGLGWWSPQLSDCLTSTAYPEEFWNCADISIVPNDGSRPTPRPTDPTPQPINPTPSTTSPPSDDPGDAGSCSGLWQQCGGSGYTGATCCQSGLQCHRQDRWYSQCRPSCPSGWDCAAPTPQPVEQGDKCSKYNGSKKRCKRKGVKKGCSWDKASRRCIST